MQNKVGEWVNRARYIYMQSKYTYIYVYSGNNIIIALQLILAHELP